MDLFTKQHQTTLCWFDNILYLSCLFMLLLTNKEGFQIHVLEKAPTQNIDSEVSKNALETSIFYESPSNNSSMHAGLRFMKKHFGQMEMKALLTSEVLQSQPDL